jgi:hypothetical protein
LSTVRKRVGIFFFDQLTALLQYLAQQWHNCCDEPHFGCCRLFSQLLFVPDEIEASIASPSGSAEMLSHVTDLKNNLVSDDIVFVCRPITRLQES